MRLAIVDRDRLSEACRQIEEWEGSQKDAAARLGVGIGQFHRLLNGSSGKALNSAVFEALYSYLPPDHATERHVRRWEERLMASLMTPAAVDALDAYGGWLRGELARFGFRLDRQLQKVVRRDPEYDRTWGVIEELREAYPGLFARLDELQPSRDGSRFDRLRFDLAYLRVVEPLLAPGGIEFRFDDLKARDQLRPYLRAAIRRECLLLGRESDLERAQNVARQVREQSTQEEDTDGEA